MKLSTKTTMAMEKEKVLQKNATSKESLADSKTPKLPPHGGGMEDRKQNTGQKGGK